jgi:hypothetical protein
MSAPPVNLDFVSTRTGLNLASGVLLALGVLATASAYLGYRYVDNRRAGLALKLDAALRQGRHDPALDTQAAGFNEQAGRLAAELGTPWTRLLAELEAASRDTSSQIALLSIEPDHEKHIVHITGESKDLPLTLAYVQRLQTSSVLRYPMLDSHDVKSDDPQRPVRFGLTAEWRELP